MITQERGGGGGERGSAWSEFLKLTQYWGGGNMFTAKPHFDCPWRNITAVIML